MTQIMILIIFKILIVFLSILLVDFKMFCYDNNLCPTFLIKYFKNAPSYLLNLKDDMT